MEVDDSTVPSATEPFYIVGIIRAPFNSNFDVCHNLNEDFCIYLQFWFQNIINYSQVEVKHVKSTCINKIILITIIILVIVILINNSNEIEVDIELNVNLHIK